jgi:hypothetical protein
MQYNNSFQTYERINSFALLANGEALDWNQIPSILFRTSYGM